MRGIIVRADFGRGLARQTYSFWKNLDWDVTVVVDMAGIQQAANKPYQWSQNLDAYPGAIVTQWKGYQAHFENPDAYEALTACDIIYTAETYYDPRLEKVPAILHVNPEFYRGEPAAEFWYPTNWNLHNLPEGKIIPTPIDDEDIVSQIPGEGRALHVGGHTARMDRNGSRLVHGILARTRVPWKLCTQDGMKMRPEFRQFCQIMGNVENHWELYEDASMLVYPRRYGGQSLQVNEAMAKGLAVLMTDCPPNLDTWPILPIEARKTSRVQTPGGTFRMYQAEAKPLSDEVHRLMNDSDLLAEWQTKSLQWARDNAWSKWKPKIDIGG
jgi:hypothetical protein